MLIKRAIIALSVLLSVEWAVAEPELIWSRNFSGSGSAECRSLCLAENGDLLLAGNTRESSMDDTDIFLVRLNIDGDTVRTRTYGSEGYESAWDLRVTPEGYYHAAGPGFAVCVDDNGDTLWTRPVANPNWFACEDMLITSDGNYVFAGSDLNGAAIANITRQARSFGPDYLLRAVCMTVSSGSSRHPTAVILGRVERTHSARCIRAA